MAGNSRAGFSGDGGPAVNAQLNAPQGIALDSGGNLYIADSLNNRVRKVDTSGIITTFAGNGNTSVPGLLGRFRSGHRCRTSKLPVGLAVDSAGKVYIAASADNTIREVTTDGIINIFAGAGYKGYYGDYSKDSISGNVTSVGIATIAGLTGPQDVAIGPKGSILIADTGNSAIRQVDPDRHHHHASPATAASASAATAWRPRWRWSLRSAWPWIPAAMSTSPSSAPTAFARSMPRARSPPRSAMAFRASPATAARPTRWR